MLENSGPPSCMSHSPIHFICPSVHAYIPVLRLVGGGTVEEDILQCAQSKLRLEHDVTASTDHSEARGGHGHNIDTLFSLYGELHLNGFGECNYSWLYTVYTNSAMVAS